MGGLLEGRLDPDDPATLARLRDADLLGALQPQPRPAEAVRLAAPRRPRPPSRRSRRTSTAGSTLPWATAPRPICTRWLATAAGHASPIGTHPRRLSALQVAYPLTLFCKSMAGAGSVPRRHLPPFVPATASEHRDPRDAPLDLPFSWFMLGLIRHRHGVPRVPTGYLLRPPPQQRSPPSRPRTSATSPSCVWSTPPLAALSLSQSPWGENDLDDARWAQVGVETLTAIIEAYLAARHGSSLNYINLVDGGGEIEIPDLMDWRGTGWPIASGR